MADVPAKLNYNESIRRIPEKVNEILDYLKRTRIQVDPRTMRKNETPAGITLSAQRQTVATPPQQLPEEPAEEYTGYFKVVNASEYDEEGKLTAAKVRIVNGSEPLASRDHAAGSISAYNNTYPIAAKTIEIDGNAGGKTYVYLRFIDATAEEPAEFVSSSSRLQDNGLNDLLMIAEISAGVKTISQLVQTTQPPAMGNTYTGAFSMVQIGRDKALIQGSNTDLGYCEAVELSTTSGPTYYMLCGWLEGEEYKVELRSSPPDAVYYGRFNIAYVKDGKFFQQWTRGAIEFKDYYYL